MGLCVENMERGQDLSPLEIVEMFVTVFCFLKDSSEVSQTLLDDFRSSQGYAFLTEFLLRYVAKECVVSVPEEFVSPPTASSILGPRAGMQKTS